MTLGYAKKLGSRFVPALIVFWLFCQSMVFCMWTMSDQPRYDDGMTALSAHQVMLVPEMSHALQAHGDHSDHNSHFSQAGSSTDSGGGHCCDSSDELLTSSSTAYHYLLSGLLAIAFAVIWHFVPMATLVGVIRQHSPPILETYPRPHLVFCTFLN